jgi:hypothetical protein
VADIDLINSSQDSTATDRSESSITWNHTLSADYPLVVVAVVEYAQASYGVSGVTVGADTAYLIAEYTSGAHHHSWFAVNPLALGSVAVTVNFGTNRLATCYLFEFENACQYWGSAYRGFASAASAVPYSAASVTVQPGANQFCVALHSAPDNESNIGGYTWDLELSHDYASPTHFCSATQATLADATADETAAATFSGALSAVFSSAIVLVPRTVCSGAARGDSDAQAWLGPPEACEPEQGETITSLSQPLVALGAIRVVVRATKGGVQELNHNELIVRFDDAGNVVPSPLPDARVTGMSLSGSSFVVQFSALYETGNATPIAAKLFCVAEDAAFDFTTSQATVFLGALEPDGIIVNTLQFVAPANGGYKYCVRLVDVAGNLSDNYEVRYAVLGGADAEPVAIVAAVTH